MESTVTKTTLKRSVGSFAEETNRMIETTNARTANANITLLVMDLLEKQNKTVEDVALYIDKAIRDFKSCLRGHSEFTLSDICLMEKFFNTKMLSITLFIDNEECEIY